ncbi:MAG: 30S ribosomal protein S6 [Deltaproteobacteria bacterium HGW-Deltaproteobacteria-20]|jgi:small subunit ribosomal protein S6|nr:MAG: 30S ribosomal protein S6 [Deltaproteobacteria bacterium HGW-Deltaproteobacteria-20]
MAEPNVMARPGAREYEAIYVLRPDIDPDAAARVSNRVSEVLARENAKLIKVESWGRRKLAYPVRKFRRGIYVFLRFHGETNLVAEFERNLRMQKDAVLKFMTIKVSDEVPDEKLEVSAEDIQFAAVEPMTEEEMDESREKVLGLVDTHDRHSRDDRGRPDRMDDMDDDVDDLDDDEER